MPVYEVPVGGQTETITSEEPLSESEQQQAALIKASKRPIEPPGPLFNVNPAIAAGSQFAANVGSRVLAGPFPSATEPIRQVLDFVLPKTATDLALDVALGGQGAAAVRGAAAAKEAIRLGLRSPARLIPSAVGGAAGGAAAFETEPPTDQSLTGRFLGAPLRTIGGAIGGALAGPGLLTRTGLRRIGTLAGIGTGVEALTGEEGPSSGAVKGGITGALTGVASEALGTAGRLINATASFLADQATLGTLRGIGRVAAERVGQFVGEVIPEFGEIVRSSRNAAVGLLRLQESGKKALKDLFDPLDQKIVAQIKAAVPAQPEGSNLSPAQWVRQWETSVEQAREDWFRASTVRAKQGQGTATGADVAREQSLSAPFEQLEQLADPDLVSQRRALGEKYRIGLGLLDALKGTGAVTRGSADAEGLRFSVEVFQDRLLPLVERLTARLGPERFEGLAGAGLFGQDLSRVGRESLPFIPIRPIARGSETGTALATTFNPSVFQRLRFPEDVRESLVRAGVLTRPLTIPPDLPPIATATGLNSIEELLRRNE